MRAAYDLAPYHITRRCRSSANVDQRLVALLDNKAACGAVAKGRSSSKRVNCLLRRLCAFVLVADVYLAPKYIPSAVNPCWPAVSPKISASLFSSHARGRC